MTPPNTNKQLRAEWRKTLIAYHKMKIAKHKCKLAKLNAKGED